MFSFLFINEDKTKDFRDPLLWFLDMFFNTMESTTEVQTETVMNHFDVHNASNFSLKLVLSDQKGTMKLFVCCVYILFFLLPALIFISACSMG